MNCAELHCSQLRVLLPLFPVAKQDKNNFIGVYKTSKFSKK